MGIELRRVSYLEFVHLPLFVRTAKGVLSEDDLRWLELELVEQPDKGATEDRAGGVRKVRASMGERGKSGSARVVYLYVPERSRIYFILAFPKSVQASLSGTQKAVIRDLVRELREEA